MRRNAAAAELRPKTTVLPSGVKAGAVSCAALEITPGAKILGLRSTTGSADASVMVPTAVRPAPHSAKVSFAICNIDVSIDQSFADRLRASRSSWEMRGLRQCLLT
jgi:hypothetical protein